MGAFESGFGWVLGAVCALVLVGVTVVFIYAIPTLATKAWTGIGRGWLWLLMDGLFGVPRIWILAGFLIFLPATMKLMYASRDWT